jgi:hypothetical protein
VICCTCGTQYPDPTRPPAACMICNDERQYIGWSGQQWVRLDTLRSTRRNEIREEEPSLVGIGTTPSFAIGQRALLVLSPAGNILWDCISLIDDETIAAINALGGIAAIAISHPHFYSSMVEWSRAFDAPVLLSAADREWIARPDDRIELWGGDTKALHDGVTLIRCGGHFDGAAVLHWPAGAAGRGALLVGDTIMVGQDRRHVSFMRSYPNLIPLAEPAVNRITAAVSPFRFDRIWSGWWSQRILTDAEASLRASRDRYLRAIGAAGRTSG